MSISYSLVQWNRHKRVYDASMLACIAIYLAAFTIVGMSAWRGDNSVSIEVLLMRALSTCALLLLHIILCIGPLARLSTRFAPLLYNRRHLGVTTCMLALAHALLAIGYYGGFGGRSPLQALLEAGSFRSISGFPFEWLGLFALVILLILASTSHDFWLKNLTPRVWKRLHMGVYFAYAAIVLHVGLGVLQSETHWVYGVLLAFGVGLVATLHTITGLREWRKDRSGASVPRDDRDAEDRDAGWIDAAGVDEVPMSRARVVCLREGERIAVFRTEQGFSAVSNVCAHQGGPLGEGKVVGGCITCPWHGYQYLAHNGQSPPPFTEKIPTYEVRVRGGRVQVHARANAPGTPVDPARVSE
jgi:nitrite reductase/ring-hydroxylating ferredoxin subunit/DMSO/TMAO reductase YedYZ heme-binding membrane subunit